MALHPDELRLARSLRELVLEFESGAEDLEMQLGWDEDRLNELMDGRRGWTMGEVFEVLEMLRVPPHDFFESHFEGEVAAGPNGKGLLFGADRSGAVESPKAGLDFRFEQSRKAIGDAVRRRSVWKVERQST